MSISTPLPAPSLLRRLAAALYDGLLVIAIWFLGTLLLLPLTGGEAIDSQHPAYLAYLILITGLFFVWFWHRSGRTLGMLAWRLRIVDGRQNPPGLRALIIRAALMLALIVAALYGLTLMQLDDYPDWLGMLCLLPLTLSMGWTLVDGQGRSLHDLGSGTQMVLLPREKR
ncbi:RDD family protein [Natronospira bacteriovora]|uniref:RDD family protein n=1 Tax=Natronospira bacteriovora TaxID=3069753 RepID=A0ABU0W621_9GAMM|nr:RDD family protein [Natronospira sp. AB-CW4]MDQ2069407.1 RDD family protein [Natronospira sp. AB-CW4]